MRATKIRLTNILGIDDIEILPGQVTRIEGRNGEGKSSIIEALKSLFAGGNDVTLLRNGAEKGEIALELSDGTEITRKVTGAGSTLSVKHATYGKVSKPQGVVETLASIASVNPVHFLSLPAKKRVEYLLEVCPIEVTTQEVEAVLDRARLTLGADGMADVGRDLDGLDAIRRWVYDLRTSVNGSAKEKRATASQLEESLPPAADLAIDYDAELAATEKALAMLEQERDEAFRQIAARYDQARAESSAASEEQGRLWTDDYMARRRAVEEQLHALDLELATRQAAVEKETIAARQSALDQRHRHESELHERLDPMIADCKENRSAITARAQDIAKHRNTAAIAAQMNDDAEGLAARSVTLTKAIEELDALKRRKLEALPIAGVEIRDGELFRDGVPFDRLNTAARIDIAFDLALLRTGELPLVFIDGAEALDAESLAHLEARAAEKGVQLLVARVTESPLTIVTDEVTA